MKICQFALVMQILVLKIILDHRLYCCSVSQMLVADCQIVRNNFFNNVHIVMGSNFLLYCLSCVKKAI